MHSGRNIQSHSLFAIWSVDHISRRGSMKDGKEDIIGPEVDTKGTIALDHHSEHVTKSSVSQQRALEGLP
jgi:hypothetical protein